MVFRRLLVLQFTLSSRCRRGETDLSLLPASTSALHGSEATFGVFSTSYSYGCFSSHKQGMASPRQRRRSTPQSATGAHTIQIALEVSSKNSKPIDRFRYATHTLIIETSSNCLLALSTVARDANLLASSIDAHLGAYYLGFRAVEYILQLYTLRLSPDILVTAPQLHQPPPNSQLYASDWVPIST